MKAAVLTLLFASCAHTTLYNPQGKKVAMIQGDITNVKLVAYPDGRLEFTAETMDHSSPTLAQGKAASLRAEGIGSAATAVGIGYLMNKP